MSMYIFSDVDRLDIKLICWGKLYIICVPSLFFHHMPSHSQSYRELRAHFFQHRHLVHRERKCSQALSVVPGFLYDLSKAVFFSDRVKLSPKFSCLLGGL